jgi:hypothetical protein
MKGVVMTGSLKCWASRTVAVGLTCLAVLPAVAAEPPPAAIDGKTVDPDSWRYNAVAYAWLMGVTGTTTVRGQVIDTNATFIDLMQKSNTLGGLMGYFEANKGFAGLYLDVIYSKLNFGASQLGYRNPLPGLRITTSASAGLTYELFTAEVGGIFEVAKWAHSETSFTALDALAGFRYWNNSLAATFDADATFDVGRRFTRFERSFGLAVARSDVMQWVDPLIGIRLRHQFTPHQDVALRGDIGGFGLGSQFAWQALAVYGYNWDLDGGRKLAAVIGFRALGINYSTGWGNDYTSLNLVLYGPVVGASFRF